MASLVSIIVPVYNAELYLSKCIESIMNQSFGDKYELILVNDGSEDHSEDIIDEKIQKYGSCRTIMIRKIANKDSAILLQNAFPILEKYIDHPHMLNGKPLKVVDVLKNEILDNFKYMIVSKNTGLNLFFTDIDKIKEIMLDELK